MKKRICLATALYLALTFTAVHAERSFTDLDSAHWSYETVNKLVDAGRINGYPDGSFQPDNQVTRWEFAKMAGGNPDEVSEPDRASTRDEAAIYLWELAGKPHTDAPSAISLESNEKDAVAWCYTYGIMQGDDGINLRLQSTLSRAEAAALIVRAENKESKPVNFIDSIKSEAVLEYIWNATNSGIAYNADSVLTNGQVARLALTISKELDSISYFALKEQPKFPGEYAKDIKLVCEEVLGTDRASEEFMNSEANIEDTIAALSFYSMRKSTGSLKIGSENYSDASLSTPMGKTALKFAYCNGIRLYSSGILNADKHVTMREAACILLQLDEIIGLNKSFGAVHPTPLLKEQYAYPSNASDYAYVLKEIPGSVYEMPILDGAKPADSYGFGINFSSVLTGFLSAVSNTMPKSVEAEWTFYPSLTVKTDDEVIMRVGLKLLKNEENLSLNKILEQNTLDMEYTGNKFIVDITTGEPMLNIIVEADNYNLLRAFK